MLQSGNIKNWKIYFTTKIWKSKKTRIIKKLANNLKSVKTAILEA